MTNFDQILSKVSIVDIVSRYLDVQRKGRNHVALCPFHDDSEPSLMISEEKQIFKCFVCNTGGNAFSFVKNFEKIDFPAAVRKVAELAGIPLEGFAAKKVDPAVLALQKINKLALTYFTYNLQNAPANSPIVTYLKQRDLNDQICKHYSLGYAPADDNLVPYLLKQGAVPAQLIELGLAYERDGHLVARMKNRLIFPIIENQQVAGFSARLIEESNQAKYVNSPESVLFKKNEILYNIDNARSASLKARKVFIVEGFMDVIALHRVGLDNCVATMGTALTAQHVKTLRSLGSEIVLTLDADKAGQMATIRALERGENLLNMRVVDYQERFDPDELYRQSPDKLLATLARTISAMDFYFKYYLTDYQNRDVDQKAEAMEKILAKISKVKGVLQLEYIKRVAQIGEYSLADIQRLVGVQKKQNEPLYRKREVRKNRIYQREEQLARLIIYLISESDDAWKQVLAGEDPRFINKVYRGLFYCLAEIIHQSQSKPVIANVISSIEQEGDQEIGELLTDIVDDEYIKSNVVDISLAQHIRNYQNTITQTTNALTGDAEEDIARLQKAALAKIKSYKAKED